MGGRANYFRIFLQEIYTDATQLDLRSVLVRRALWW